MNIAVLILLGLALALQVVAFFLVANVEVEAEEVEPGKYELGAKLRASRFGLSFAVGGIILATIGSGLSLWAPGFD